MGITLQMPSAPIQLDANLGWAAAVQEMLLYASPELIKILPACPGKWEQGQVEGLRFCTGAADISWNRGKGELKAVLTAERPTQAKLKLPEGYGEYELACSKGSVQRLDKSSCWRIELPAGAQLLVCSKS